MAPKALAFVSLMLIDIAQHDWDLSYLYWSRPEILVRDHHIQSNWEIIVLDSHIQSNWDMRALSHCMWSNWGMRAKDYDIHHSSDTSVKVL